MRPYSIILECGNQEESSANANFVIRHIVKESGEDPIISTTGKASRELFGTRVANGQSHKYDFLTVGSMGHSSSVALGVALNKPEQRIWCIDGDGVYPGFYIAGSRKTGGYMIK